MKMPKIGSILLVTAFSAISSIAAVSAPAGEAAVVTVPTVVLDSEVTVTGDGHTVLDVHIPVDVTYSAKAEGGTFNFDTEAEFAAIALVEDRASDAQVLLAGQADVDLLCPTGFEQCREAANGVKVRQRQTVAAPNGKFVLHAGDYRVHLVTRGGPATASIRFDEMIGLGEKSYEGVKSDGAWVETPSNDTLVPGPGAYTATADRSLRSQGLAWTILSATGDLGLVGEYGICVWQGGRPATGADRVPTCPTAAMSYPYQRVEVSTESEVATDLSLTGLPAGEYAFTGYFGGAGRVNHAAVVTLFLEY